MGIGHEQVNTLKNGYLVYNVCRLDAFDIWKVGNELPLFDGVCKCQKWVENANQTQLKPMIWYTS